METYNILIDRTMIENIVQTDVREAFDLMSWELFAYLIVLGLLPSYLIYKTPLVYRGFKKELVSKVTMIIGSMVLIFFITSHFIIKDQFLIDLDSITNEKNLYSYWSR